MNLRAMMVSYWVWNSVGYGYVIYGKGMNQGELELPKRLLAG
jgi:hypothetical protein